MGKKYCIAWDDEETPRAEVIEIEDEQEATRVVLDLLTNSWGWTAEELSERNENVHVIEITEETQTDPRVVGTIALFREDGEESGDNFTDLITIYKGETAKQALMERATPKLNDATTFKMPDVLLAKTYCWAGTPLLMKVTSSSSVTVTIIGFVLFIDRSLAKALETFDLQRCLRWFKEPSDGYTGWPAQVIADFSAHIQMLCEDHSVDAPCPLE